MLQIPIFHVNGEYPEAVAQVVRLGMDFRREFKRDVVINMYGYRRLGHNEGDEPAFTQPVLYRAIAQRKTVREGYLEHLLKLGGVTQEEADAIAASRREALEKALAESQAGPIKPATELHGVWSNYRGGPEPPDDGPQTSVEREKLVRWLEGQSKVPESFHPHPKIKRFLEARAKMAAGKQPLDWSAAESLAFVSLANEGF